MIAWLERKLGLWDECGDLSEEIEQHIAERAELLVQDGIARAEALLTARKEFGNVTLLQEQSRDV